MVKLNMKKPIFIYDSFTTTVTRYKSLHTLGRDDCPTEKIVFPSLILKIIFDYSILLKVKLITWSLNWHESWLVLLFFLHNLTCHNRPLFHTALSIKKIYSWGPYVSYLRLVEVLVSNFMLPCTHHILS